MVGRLQDKVCVITGAAGGIGLESAILFAREGGKLVLTDVNEAALARAVARVQELNPGAPVVSRVCDVSKEGDVEALVSFADETFPAGVDVMFNNAGIMHPADDDALTTEERVWDLTHAINVKGVWFGCKYAIKSMLAHKKTHASIINTASFVAIRGAATPQLAYTASKGAVLALTRELACVHARDGIRINALCPGPLNTPMLQKFLDSEEKRFRRLVHAPTGRFGEAVEQAHAAVFLASDESSFIIGQDFLVDGGLSIAYVTPEGPPAVAPSNNA